MTIRRWSRIAGWLTLTGSVAWLAKFAVIVASDGRILDTGAAAWLLRCGLICLLLGATGFALWITRHGRPITRYVAVLLSPVAFLGSFVAADALVAAAVGTRGPAYLQAEAGIVVVAAVWLGLGGWLVARTNQLPYERPHAVPGA